MSRSYTDSEKGRPWRMAQMPVTSASLRAGGVAAAAGGADAALVVTATVAVRTNPPVAAARARTRRPQRPRAAARAPSEGAGTDEVDIVGPPVGRAVTPADSGRGAGRATRGAN